MNDFFERPFLGQVPLIFGPSLGRGGGGGGHGGGGGGRGGGGHGGGGGVRSLHAGRNFGWIDDDYAYCPPGEFLGFDGICHPWVPGIFAARLFPGRF